MNLESLKNMDVNDLLAKLKGQSDIFKDKKLMIKIGVGFGAILIFLIISSGCFQEIQTSPMLMSVISKR